MERWSGRTALVTGASVGIGRQVTEDLARHGVTVIACARNIESIEELAKTVAADSKNGKIHAVKCDLIKEENILQLFKFIEDKFKHVDILVNNAGLSNPDNLLTGRTEKWREMIDLNVVALSVCAREALRLMEKHKIDDGHIININSMAGHGIAVNLPSSHFYAATKHMVTALSKALNAELRQKKTKIRVTNVSPGYVATEFGKRVLAAAPPGGLLADREAFAAFANLVALSSKDISNAILYAVSAPAHVAIHELIIAPTEQPAF